MDPTSAFFQRRKASQQSAELTRQNWRTYRSAGRSSRGVTNKITDDRGRTVGYALRDGSVYKSSSSLGSPLPGSRQQADGPDTGRASRVTAAMRDGSFWQTQRKFNEANAGKQVMDQFGNIAPASPASQNMKGNPYITGGQLPGATREGGAPSPAPSTAAEKPAAPAYRPPQLPTGPLAPKGRIFDNGKDVTGDIVRGLAGDKTGSFYASRAPGATPTAVASPSGMTVTPGQGTRETIQAQVDKTQALIDQTQKLMPKQPAAAASVAAAPASPAPQPKPALAPVAPAATDPAARTAATMAQAGAPGVAQQVPQPPTANPATTPARVDTRPVAPADASKIRSIAGDRGAFYRNIWPAITGQFSTQSKAAPILQKYGVTAPSSYPNPAARVAGDNETVDGLVKQGVIQGQKTVDAGGQEGMKLTVNTPQPVLPKTEPGSMGQRQMTMPLTEDPMKKRPFMSATYAGK